MTKADENRRHTIEVKYDSVIRRSGNIFVEIKRDIDKDLNGWMNIIQAELMFYVCAHSHQCYVFKVADLREYLKNNRCPSAMALDEDGEKYSQGLLVPLADFSKYLVTTI